MFVTVLIIGILVGVMFYLIVVFISFSLMTNEVEHIFW